MVKEEYFRQDKLSYLSIYTPIMNHLHDSFAYMKLKQMAQGRSPRQQYT